MAGADKPTVKLSHRMSAQDASFIYGESRSGPLHIGLLNIFDAPIDYDDLLEHMARRIHLLPRYRQRLVFAPLNLAHATLENDPGFDLRKHIKSHSLPDGADDKIFLSAAMSAFEPMLDRNKPLWEMHLFQGLAGNRSAVVWKVHHCLVDGVSGMELMTVSLDFRADAPPPEPSEIPWRPPPLPNALRSLATALFDLAKGGLNEALQLAARINAPRSTLERATTTANFAAKLAAMIGRRIVAAPWNAALVSSARSLALFKAPFADLRSIRNALGGTVNDAVLAILSEAAARYMAEHGVRTDHAPLRIGCPVNVRHGGESGALGNRVSMMFPELPSAPMDAVARLHVVIRETNRIKHAGDARALEQMIGAGDLIAPFLMGLISRIGTTAIDAASKLGGLAPWLARIAPLAPPGINFIATNVPGAQAPLYLAGRKLIEMVGLVPLGANLGYNVAVVSYNQMLTFGMMTEPRLIPDVERMRGFAENVFNELMAAAHARTGESADSPRAA